MSFISVGSQSRKLTLLLLLAAVAAFGMISFIPQSNVFAALGDATCDYIDDDLDGLVDEDCNPTNPTNIGASQVVKIDINGQGANAVVAPGAALTVSGSSYLLPAPYCPGCVRQLYISVAANPLSGTGTQGSVCFNQGTMNSTPEGFSTGAFTAPTAGGTYYITARVNLDYVCYGGYWGGTVVGTFTVNACNGLQATIIGTSGDDSINGTAGDDVIVGLAGNDTINGKGGNDTICGDDGDDRIYGKDGADFISGGDGNDVVYGGEGNDKISGNGGDDRLKGDAGDDTIFGNAGNDTLSGYAGNDHLSGGDDNDRLYGGDDNDRMDGGSGDDSFYAGSGNDFLEGGTGSDRLRGEAGFDFCAGGPDADLDVTSSCEVEVAIP
mgnify:CR=1 FL=1